MIIIHGVKTVPRLVGTALPDRLRVISIAARPDFRRLMRAACLRLGQLVNQTELGRDVALAQPTVQV